MLRQAITSRVIRFNFFLGLNDYRGVSVGINFTISRFKLTNTRISSTASELGHFLLIYLFRLILLEDHLIFGKHIFEIIFTDARCLIVFQKLSTQLFITRMISGMWRKTLKKSWSRYVNDADVFIVNYEAISLFFLIADIQQVNVCWVHIENAITFEDKIGCVMFLLLTMKLFHFFF